MARSSTITLISYSTMTRTLPSLSALLLLAASACATQPYKGEFGYRQNIPTANCGEAEARGEKSFRVAVRGDMNLPLFKEFGYCAPEQYFNHIALRAGYHNGT